MVVFFIPPNSVQCKRQLELISYQKSWSDDQNVCKSPRFLRIAFTVVLHVTQCFSCLFGFFLIVVQDVAYTYLIQRAWNSLLQNFFFFYFNQSWKLFSIWGKLSWKRPDSKCRKKNLEGLDSCFIWFVYCIVAVSRWGIRLTQVLLFVLYIGHCVCRSAVFLPALHRVSLLQLGVNSWCCLQVLEVLLCFMSSLSPLLYVLQRGSQ